MKKPAPIKVSRRNHIRLIVVLLAATAVAVALSRRPFGSFRPAAPGKTIGHETRPKGAEKGRPSPGAVFETPSATTAKPGTEAVSGGLELPAIASSEFVIRNEAGRYTLMYDTACRQAAWVAYLLTRLEAEKKGTERKNVFRSDPEVVARGWPTATVRDYARSGFDRGHLLPSADRNDSADENGATFYLSNVSPQRPGLNRGPWRLLEEQVRRWAVRYDSLYIVTGGELRASLPRIAGSVSVPERYFKAILVCSDGEWRAAAFLLPNEDPPAGRFADYMCSVDSVEQELGMDFFAALPDSIEHRVEAVLDRSFWR